MNIIYCNKCKYLEHRRSGTGKRFYCNKNDKWYPINTTERDMETNYCVNGGVPRKSYNERCGNNEWE